MYEPLTALEFEQKASKLLEKLKSREFSGENNIKYLSAILLDFYNDGFNDAVVVLGKLK